MTSSARRFLRASCRRVRSSSDAGIAEVLARNELKVVVPQDGQDLDALAALDFEHRLLQPMDGPLARQNTAWAIAHCLADPRWRLSVQTHKSIGIR